MRRGKNDETTSDNKRQLEMTIGENSRHSAGCMIRSCQAPDFAFPAIRVENLRCNDGCRSREEHIPAQFKTMRQASQQFCKCFAEPLQSLCRAFAKALQSICNCRIRNLRIAKLRWETAGN